jgi:hypothetical protein
VSDIETVLTHPKALSEVIRVVGFFLLSGKFFSGGANHEGIFSGKKNKVFLLHVHS